MAWFKKKNPLAEEVEQLRTELAAVKNEISIIDAFGNEKIFLDTFRLPNPVSQDTAMRVSAVFACVRLIAGAISSAPLNIYRSGSLDPIESHPFLNMLSLSPNPHITASVFWKTLAANKVLNGNAYAAINRAPSGRAVSLVPLAANRVTPYQAWELRFDETLKADPHRLFYYVTWDNGTMSVLDQDDMIHVPNIGWDGKQGLSTIKAGAQAMGLAISAEESATKMFSNGMQTNFAISYPNKLAPDAADRLKKYIEEKYQGSTNHHKPLILTEGGDIKQLSLNAEDAQLIESRQFSVIDIARFFGVPPIMIGESEKTSSWGSGVEQMFRAFHTLTMNDHYTDFEQEINRKIFRGSDYRVNFDESELTRGDTKTRAEYFKAALGGTQNPGWMTQNQVRKAEGMEKSSDPEADKLYRPVPSKGGDQDVQEQTDAVV